MWIVPTRGFASLGWQEFSLPDGVRYFSNDTLHTVTDVDLSHAERLESVTNFLEGHDTEVLPPPEWELWLREASGSTAAFIKAWVHHGARMVLLERPSSDPGEIINKGLDSTSLRVHLPSVVVLMFRQRRIWNTNTGHLWCRIPPMHCCHRDLFPKPSTS